MIAAFEEHTCWLNADSVQSDQGYHNFLLLSGALEQGLDGAGGGAGLRVARYAQGEGIVNTLGALKSRIVPEEHKVREGGATVGERAAGLAPERRLRAPRGASRRDEATSRLSLLVLCSLASLILFPFRSLLSSTLAFASARRRDARDPFPIAALLFSLHDA